MPISPVELPFCKVNNVKSSAGAALFEIWSFELGDEVPIPIRWEESIRMASVFAVEKRIYLLASSWIKCIFPSVCICPSAVPVFLKSNPREVFAVPSSLICKPSPCTDKSEAGLEVPIPTRWEVSIVIAWLPFVWKLNVSEVPVPPLWPASIRNALSVVRNLPKDEDEFCSNIVWFPVWPVCFITSPFWLAFAPPSIVRSAVLTVIAPLDIVPAKVALPSLVSVNLSPAPSACKTKLKLVSCASHHPKLEFVVLLGFLICSW